MVGPDEQLPLMEQCLTEAGFPVGRDGYRTFPNDQGEAFDVAFYTCSAQYPIEDKYLAPPTEEQLRILHDYWAGEVVPCLGELGLDIPAPPSFETFLASSGSAGQYTPSGQLYDLNISEQAVDAALKQCPENPPASLMFPE